MTFFSTRPWARWTVPAVAASMIAAGTVAATVAATASTPLPPRTAAQLLVDLQEAQLAGLSGTVVQTSNLGIPDFPGAPSNSGIDGASSDLTSLVAGPLAGLGRASLTQPHWLASRSASSSWLFCSTALWP